ncbi:MAG: UbiH/UbiF/VisC/COQ6 family ubiquinone biosynthesis hydroxylase [Pseudomonadota bacterium]
MSESANKQNFDLVIVGGGMVGSALGCAAAQAGFEVCVVEAREPQSEWPAEEVDLRVSALSRASQRILENLGVWERMLELRVSPYSDMRVWDAGGDGRSWRPASPDTGTSLFGGSIHFSAADIDEPNLGHIVENRVTQLALWEQLGRLSNVTRLCPAEIDNLEIGDSPALSLKDGSRLPARLIVGADGRESLVRRLASIGTQGWDYDQHAIVATVKPERHHQYTAWQRFMPTGPLAFLPLDDGRCSIVWSTAPALAEALMAMQNVPFCQALTAASDGVLGEILDAGPRGVFPLRLGHAETYIRQGLALVGDAAHAIHPLAGQGVNLGFLDAATLIEVLIAARDSGRNIGGIPTLRRYERARKGANLGMLGAMDFFKRFFSNDVPPLKVARNLGLSLADHAGPVKHLIIKRAMGLTGERPALAR